ncbi:ABC transporter domain-containing protein [Candidatus Hydrogenisulfobacillus filiaventi]|uniref:ABC transporter domain-containing protein n=1 Tax=Candidatus Hydrogenisulfobacillus filiaventi TaxID=2707344 RepID=A0A6F8ZEL4_9FIRM|nr:ABC transporter domain-containing protein [Candidatus Hydrogenisulfobacillus filiaventi]
MGLEVQGLRKRFGSETALDGLDLIVEEGQVYGLVGPNGAGKTTAMRILLRILDADAGTVRWNGQPLAAVPRQQFAYVPEERGLYPRMTVEEQLDFFGRLWGLDPAEARRRGREWLERLELAPYRTRAGSELSKGNARKLQLAVALLARPRLLVLDEPFEGLDPVNVAVLEAAIREARGQGTTVLFSSHTMEFVEALCDGVTLITHGRALLAGPVAAVRAAAGWRELTIRFLEADPARLERFETLAGLPAGEAVGGRRYRVAPDVDPGFYLSRAQQAGTLRTFSLDSPSLKAVYLQTVGGEMVPA